MKQKLLNYQPFNEQEEKDKELLLKVIEQKDVLTRKNTIGHFTVSCWVLNQSHDKVLMCYHKIYNSWCWLGGHVDGQKDFKKVASLVYLSQVQDIINIKALKEDDETKSYQLLYKFDDLLKQLEDTIAEYVNMLEKEQKVTKELQDSVYPIINIESMV